MMLTRLKDRCVSVLLWALGLCWAVPTMLFLTLYWKLTGRRDLEWFVRLQCRGQVAVTGSKWKAVVHPDVQPHTPYMFMQNHTNHLDYGVLAWAVPHHRLQGMELERHFKYPVYGWFMKARGTIPVRSGEKNQLARLLADMRARVEQG
jgi:1-acyl-sn-glycerol-3-phosphate acyltransferase